MRKWEYQIQMVPKIDDVILVLNKLGDQGWDLVQAVGTTLYLKREKK